MYRTSRIRLFRRLHLPSLNLTVQEISDHLPAGYTDGVIQGLDIKRRRQAVRKAEEHHRRNPA